MTSEFPVARPGAPTPPPPYDPRMRRRTGRAVAAAASALLLAGCSAPASDVSVTALPTDTGPAPALTDVGSRSQVAEVRAAAERALTASLRIFDMDERGRPLTTGAERAHLIDTTTTGPRRTDLEHSLSALGQRPFRRGGRFVVDHWDGVQVVGDRTRVYVSGHSAYTPTSASPQRRDGTWQYQLLLVRSGGRWLELRGRAASDEQG